MQNRIEIDDINLEKVTGGDTGSIAEIYGYADKMFLDITYRSGTLEDLDNALKLVNDKIYQYYMVEMKLTTIDKPIIDGLIQDLYQRFAEEIKNR